MAFFSRFPKFRKDFVALLFPVIPWATIIALSLYGKAAVRLLGLLAVERSGIFGEDCGFIPGLCERWVAASFNRLYPYFLYPSAAVSFLLGVFGAWLLWSWWRSARPLSVADTVVATIIALSYVAFAYAYFSTFSAYFVRDPYSMIY